MATVGPEQNGSSRRSDKAESIRLREQSPPSKIEVQPLKIKKLRPESSSNGTATDRGRDLKQKRPVLEDDTFQPPRYQDREPANQTLTTASSSQPSTLRRPTSPSCRRSTRVSSHLHNVTASSPPRNNGETTPVRSTNGAHNIQRRSNSYTRSPPFDYASYSPASVAPQINQKLFQQDASPSTASRVPNQRHSSISSTSARQLLSQYTFDSPRAGPTPYNYLPGDDNVEDSQFLDGDGGPEMPVQMGIPNLRIASNAVMKANLRSGDPYQDLSLFLDNVNGMLTSLTLSIPHLQLLCNRYRSLQEKLVEYNALAEVSRAHEEVVEQKEKQILSLKETLNQMTSIHSAEGNRMRNKIGSLEAEIRIFNEIIVSKNDEIEKLASRLNEEKERLKSEGEDWATANGELLAAEKMELLEKHEAEIEILEEGHQANVTELEGAHLVEKTKMIDSYESKIIAMQDRHRAEINEIHEKKSAELKEIHHQVASQLEDNQKAKLSELKDSYTLELRALESKFYTKLDTLKVDVGRRKAELEKAHAAEKKNQLEKFEKERALWVIEKEQLEGQIKYLQYEKNTTAFTHEAEKNSLVELVEISEQASRRLETENERLSVLLKRISDAEREQEMTGRGDDFYIDAFTTITRDIVNISQNFMDLPRVPLNDAIAELPSNLPNILGQTNASRILRQAYIQHIISTILCKRIFSPFLFSLADRYDNADSLLKAMSAHLHKISMHREAIWRHYTLMAAHTANSAKSHATSAAAVIIEEIISRIRPFAGPENIDKISAGVRKVVEYAADVWQHARLEKEMFVAWVENEKDDTEWGHHPYETQFPYSSDSKLVTSLRANPTGRRKLVLHLLPLIYREGTVPSVTHPDAVLDDGRVFTPGVALFSDCLPVLHRIMELHLPGSDLTSLSIDSENEIEGEGGNTRKGTLLLHLKERVRKKSKEELERLDKGLVEADPVELQEIAHKKTEHEERLGNSRSSTGRAESKKKGRVRTKTEKVEWKAKGGDGLNSDQKRIVQRGLTGEETEQGMQKQEKTHIRMEKDGGEKIEETGRKARQGETEVVQIKASSEYKGFTAARAVLPDNRKSAREDRNENALIEAEIKDVADAGIQLIQDEKRQRQLEEEAIELARVEFQVQREEEMAREVALREAVEAESMARAEAYIRDGEEAEAQLIAEEKVRLDKLKLEAEEKRRLETLRLEGEAKAAASREKDLERERITQKELRRKALRAKIEAEVAARKLEREKQRLRLKAEAEERDNAQEPEISRSQVLAEAEAEERFRLNSDNDREFLQGKVLTPVFAGTAKEVNTESGVKVPPLGGDITETTSDLAKRTNESNGDGGGLVAVKLDQSGRDVGEDTPTRVLTPPERENEQATEIGTTNRDLPVDEASTIWLRLSEPGDGLNHNAITQNISREKGLIHDIKSGEIRSVDESISHSGDQGHAIIGDVIQLSDKITVEDNNINREHENLEVDTSEFKHTTIEVHQKEKDRRWKSAVAGKQDGSRENIQAKCADQSEEKRNIIDEVDIWDDSFDSTGADVGREDDEESDFEHDDTSHEGEGPDDRGTLIEEDDGVLTELPALPATLEGETPGGVELAKFDFGLQAESGRDDNADRRSQSHDWNAHHGSSESSEDEGSNGRRLDKRVNAERRNTASVLAFSIIGEQSNGDSSETSEMHEGFGEKNEQEHEREHEREHGVQHADNFDQMYGGHNHRNHGIYGIHEEQDDMQSEEYEGHEIEGLQQLQSSDIDSKIDGDEDDLNDRDRAHQGYQGSDYSSQLDAPVDEHHGSDLSRGGQHETQHEKQHLSESEWNQRNQRETASQDGDGGPLQQGLEGFLESDFMHPDRWSDMHIESDYDEQYDDEHEARSNLPHMHNPTDRDEEERKREVDDALENKGNWNEDDDDSSIFQEHRKDEDGLTNEQLHDQDGNSKDGEADTNENLSVVADGPHNTISTSPLPPNTSTEAHHDVATLPTIPGEVNEQVDELDRDGGEHRSSNDQLHESQDNQQHQDDDRKDHGNQKHDEHHHDHQGHQENQENHPENQHQEDPTSNRD